MPNILSGLVDLARKKRENWEVSSIYSMHPEGTTIGGQQEQEGEFPVVHADPSVLQRHVQAGEEEDAELFEEAERVDFSEDFLSHLLDEFTVKAKNILAHVIENNDEELSRVALEIATNVLEMVDAGQLEAAVGLQRVCLLARAHFKKLMQAKRRRSRVLATA
ncbi:MAG: hypothetical protein V1926_02645 [Candidatus Peregrinibacteria bacterium]